MARAMEIAFGATIGVACALSFMMLVGKVLKLLAAAFVAVLS